MALCLSMKVGESIFIDGEKIELILLAIKGNQVQLAFTADRSISINREKIWKKIKGEKGNE